MAAFFLVRDADPDRRRRGLEAAGASIRRFDLEFGSDVHGTVGLAWGTAQGAPLDRAPGVFVMGDLITDSGPERMRAAAYLEHTRAHGVPPACDGFYFAATFDPQGALTIGVDLPGSFPLYYAEIGGALVAASSPALIATYPGFRSKPDVLGIASLLLINGSLRGRTLQQSIRRLSAGHVLIAPAGGPPREARIHAVEMHRESHDVPGEACTERLYDALRDAARRHVQNDVPHSMMLSGGLDSRLIIGVLAAQGVPLNALTHGGSDELEWKCARAVGKELGLEHHRIPHPHHAPANFDRLVWWMGLTSAPGTGGGGFGRRVPHAREHVVSGLSADPVLGGLTTMKPYDRTTRAVSTDRYERSTNKWGVPMDHLPGLLRKDVFGDSLETVRREFRDEYENAAETHMARSWLHSMRLRQRFAVGGMWIRLAFTAWPKMPHLDRKVMHTAAGIPLPLLSQRRIEREMLERFHTNLARLPLDRNDMDTTPPLPGVLDLVRAGIDRRIRRVRSRLGIPRPEKRHYHIAYDFNGPAWRALRRHAEADRERVYDYFERDAYDALVPRPEERWTPTGTIEGAAGVKLLVAFGVWLRLAESERAPTGTST